MKTLKKAILMHKVVWQTINYKAQPEKVVPAKEAYTLRRFSIKEYQKD